jgi:hypothetical protein
VTRELVVLDPKSRRSWYLLGKVQLDLGMMYIENNEPAKAREALLAANEGFARGLAMDPADTVMLECRTTQFAGVARIAWASGDVREARRWMQRCLEVMRVMIKRDASVKSYIGDYEDKLKLAGQIGLSTTDFYQTASQKKL